MGKFFNKPIEDKQEQIDFSKLSDDELLNQFKTENWNALTDKNQQIALLQEVENRNALINGRTPATVIETSDPTLLGSYSRRSNIISINLNSNPYENLDSIIHEGQHANQSFATTNASNLSSIDKSLINLEYFPSINANQSHYEYYQSANNQDLYNIYSSELNTNNTAFAFVYSQNERYKNDANYANYLQNRAHHYNAVVNDLNNLSGAKKDAIIATLNTNHKNGLISDDQYKSLIDYLNNTKNYDSFEQTAINNHQILDNMHSKQQNETNNLNQNDNSYLDDVNHQNETTSNLTDDVLTNDDSSNENDNDGDSNSYD